MNTLIPDSEIGTVCNIDADCTGNTWCNNGKCDKPPSTWTKQFYDNSIRELTGVNIKDMKLDFTLSPNTPVVLSSDHAKCIIDNVSKKLTPNQLYQNADYTIKKVIPYCLQNPNYGKNDNDKDIKSLKNNYLIYLFLIFVIILIILLIINKIK